MVPEVRCILMHILVLPATASAEVPTKAQSYASSLQPKAVGALSAPWVKHHGKTSKLNISEHWSNTIYVIIVNTWVTWALPTGCFNIDL